MHPHLICTVLVRLIGLILAVVMLIPALSTVATLAAASFAPGVLRRPWSSVAQVLSHAADAAVLAAFVAGLYLFLDGRWVVRRLLRGVHHVPGLCPHCGYDIRGLESSRCPECGNKLPPHQA